MSDVRVNLGITLRIDDIINKEMYLNGGSRSSIIRDSIRQRYRIDWLDLEEGPFDLYVRVNIPKRGVAYVRKMAYKNNISMATAYSSIINKYICSG